jgi:hypothetical protein
MPPSKALFNKDQLISLGAFITLLIVVTVYMLNTFTPEHAANISAHEAMMPPPITASP